MPKAVYTLTRDQKKRIFEWITSLKFPDGYASNLSRCVDMANLRLHGMKSHDCHVFMQKLIPIAFCEMLLESVWGALTEVSLLFQILCSTTLDVNKVQELEDTVPIIMCNLEKIFPPSFFDSMVHLIVHLPYEALVGGPVQYRWMYPFERFLRGLKMKVKNKAHVEASIVEAYLVEEIGLFCSQYFEPQVLCKRNRPGRNDELTMNDTRIQQSIFNLPGRASGVSKKRWLSGSERHIIETYILTNCEVVMPYYESFLDGLYERYHEGDPIIEEVVVTQFKDWFKCSVSVRLFTIRRAIFLSAEVTTFHCYFVIIGALRQSSSYTDTDNDFYGILEEVIQLDYPLIPNMQIVLFKCRWMDPVRGMKVHPRYHLVDVNFKKAVYKIKARRVIDDSRWTEVAFQEDETVPTPQVLIDEQYYELHDPTGIQLVCDLYQEGVGTSRNARTDSEDEHEEESFEEGDYEDEDDNYD
ncbi:UNVERIFIED_CONTAM: hypothetical protein Slati_3492800 [Sesamum latifolium]|uniref:DUF4218 domain-containing protein n=1 Tax=Sesamum latifolium TaxID=2727402 RepID=A0AAW2UI09_9LAMI